MKINSNNKHLSSLITRFLVIIILLLFILILNKYNHSFTLKLKNEIFNKSFNFIKINKLSQKLLGKDVFYYQNNNDATEVLSNSFILNDKNKYYDAEKLIVSDNLPIGSISSGVVVFIGEKDLYHNTVIVQGMDGYNIWYGNLKDININNYDYVEEHNLLGAADGNYIYLLIEKDNNFYTYDEYIKNKN